MKSLKNLIAVKKNLVENPTQEFVSDQRVEAKTYFDEGKSRCIVASGSPDILKNCLIEVYQNFKSDQIDKKAEQEKLKKPFIDEQNRQYTELAKRNLLKERKQQNIDDLREEIKTLDQNIAEVSENPNKFGISADRKPKAQFYIGLSILLPITLYLLVFYISASYSAFFKEFSPDTTIFAAIFDGKALTKAWNDANGGFLEVVFICTIPFAFMGLGYLIHMFQKTKDKVKFKLISLFLITFIFDAILAYQIEKKIFDFEKLPGEVFDINIAIQSVEFWGIIFAGYVVYIIWGLVFDFVMKEYSDIDKIKNYIEKLRFKKELISKNVEELKMLLISIDDEIAEIEGKISNLQTQIDGFIFERRKYLRYHSEFLSGWLIGISSEIAMPNERQENLIRECNSISDEHLRSHNVTMTDEEIVIYT